MNEIFEHLNVIEGNDTGGDQEKTVECKTLEEYTMRKKAYLDAVFLQTIDVNNIIATISLPEYRKHIASSRLILLDKKIDEGEFALNMKNAKYNSYPPIFWRESLKDVSKYSKNIVSIPKTGLFIINEIKIQGMFGWIVSENVGVDILENISVRRGSKLSEFELNYVASRLFLQYEEKPLMKYHEPIRPLPPELLDGEQKKQLEITLEIEKNKIILRDNVIFLLKTVGIVEKKENIMPVNATRSKSIDAKQFSIGGEAVDKKVYDVYNQFKRDRMIKQHEIGELGPKTVTQKYQNLSWEYFKTNILNKDERYMVR